MLNKSDVWGIVSETFDDTKTDGLKKTWLRAAHNFSELSKQNIRGITNNEAKYRKFNGKILIKVNQGWKYLLTVANLSSGHKEPVY